jgi:polyisoprenyl-teichoic acid--peptidoglycan teichoic acid transferase
MPDPYNNQYDPTEPIQPPPVQGGQGKLILGNSQNQPGSSQRKPYQYPQSQQPPQQGGAYRQPGPQVPPPNARLDDTRYPDYPQPGQNPNYPQPRQNPNYPQPGQIARPGAPKGKRKGRGCLITSLVLIVLVVALVIMGVTTTQRVLAFGSAISPQTPLSSQISLGADRTNVLIMGYGGSGHDGAYLTDSNVVISLIPNTHHTSLISVPRDLWVTYPQGSGQRTKLNAIYTLASNGTPNSIAGGDAVAAKISLITGLDVKYWMTINFSGFRNLINTIGGVDVNVQTPFNACYPANDDPNVNPNWTTVNFKKGVQHMDGETAIRYARAREPLAVCSNTIASENQAQLSDFARSQRQQDIMKAVLAKIKQATTWPSFFNALTALQKTIYTNLSLNDLARFALAMDLNNPNTPHIGLTNGNVLQDVYLSNGTYTLQPQNGDWTLIPPYIKQRLYN